MRSVAVVIGTIHLQEEEILITDEDLIGLLRVKSWTLIAGTFRGFSRSLEQNVCRGTENFFQVGFRLFFTTCQHKHTNTDTSITDDDFISFKLMNTNYLRWNFSPIQNRKAAAMEVSMEVNNKYGYFSFAFPLILFDLYIFILCCT